MRTRLALTLVALGLAAGIAGAADPVPTYTNADLVKFGAPTSAPGTLVRAPAPAADWTAVQTFLDQQYARIDADRQHELDRRQADRDDAAQDLLRPQDSYWMPYSNVWPYYGDYGHGYAGFSHYGGGAAAGYPGYWSKQRISLYPGSSGRTGAEQQRAFLNQRPTIHGAAPLRQPPAHATRPDHGGHGGHAGQGSRGGHGGGGHGRGR